jgi:hypothetical protein
MNRIATLIASIYALISLLSAAGYLKLGMDYLDMNIGHGLNPIIAFPMVMVCLFLACCSKLLHSWLTIIFNEKDEDILESDFQKMRAALSKQ